MNRNNFSKGLFVLPLLLVFGGCTAGFNTMPIQELEPSPTIPYWAIRVDVNPALAEDATQELTDLEIQLMEGIKELGAVKKVVLEHPGTETENSLLIRVTVSNLRKVSGTSRFFLGSFAGKAKMTALVDFIDGNDGTELGKYKIVGSSGGSGFSGGTEDAVTQTAEAIITILAENYSIP
ncbi:MAG: DUF4410 domain-containing protein, partial [Candidatus Krumholzibacteriota bacterium]